MLCGCETSLLGEWNGTCMFADANQESLVSHQYCQARQWLSSRRHNELYTWEDDTFEGDMIGDHNGKYVMFRGSFDTEAGPYQYG